MTIYKNQNVLINYLSDGFKVISKQKGSTPGIYILKTIEPNTKYTVHIEGEVCAGTNNPVVLWVMNGLNNQFIIKSLEYQLNNKIINYVIDNGKGKYNAKIGLMIFNANINDSFIVKKLEVYNGDIINNKINNTKIILNKPKVAILIPCYNEKKKYLQECIESAININYENKTIFLLDDGTIDKTIFNEYIDKIIILTQINLKLPSTLHNLFYLTKKYDFVTWGSSDNIWGKNFLNIHLQYMYEYNCDITYSNYYIIDDNSTFNYNKISWFKYDEPYDNSNISNELKCLKKVKDIQLHKKSLLNGENYIGCSFLIRKNIFKYYINYQGVEDYDFWLYCIYNNYKFKYIDTIEKIYLYRVHDDSLTSKANNMLTDKNKIHLKNRYLIKLCYDKLQNNNDIFLQNKTNIDIFINKILNMDNLDIMEKFFLLNVNYQHLINCLKNNNKYNLDFFKQYLTENMTLNICEFKMPKIITNKRIKILVLTQHYMFGGLENILNLIKKYINIYDITLSSYVKSNNILSFDSDIDKVVKYINNNNIDILDIHYTLFNLKKIKENTKVKIIYNNHNSYFWFDKEMIELFKYNDKFINLYINVSETVQNNYIKLFDISANKSLIINNGIEVNNFNIDTNNSFYINLKNKYNKFNKIFLTVGSITNIKGQLELIKAFNNLKNNNYGLIILGKIIPDFHNYIDSITNFINSNNLNNNIFFESCDYNYIKYYYHICDIFVLCSYLEGCSQSIKEAIYFKKKIIISDVGSNRFLSTKFNNIILVDITDKYTSLESFNNFIYNNDKNDVINKIYLAINKSVNEKYVEYEPCYDIISVDSMINKRIYLYYMVINYPNDMYYLNF